MQQGLQQAMEEGRRAGELKVLRRIIEKRFGPIPAWAEESLSGRSTAELETSACAHSTYGA
jgi:hypothetical protein